MQKISFAENKRQNNSIKTCTENYDEIKESNIAVKSIIETPRVLF